MVPEIMACIVFRADSGFFNQPCIYALYIHGCDHLLQTKTLFQYFLYQIGRQSFELVQLRACELVTLIVIHKLKCKL